MLAAATMYHMGTWSRMIQSSFAMEAVVWLCALFLCLSLHSFGLTVIFFFPLGVYEFCGELGVMFNRRLVIACSSEFVFIAGPTMVDHAVYRSTKEVFIQFWANTESDVSSQDCTVWCIVFLSSHCQSSQGRLCSLMKICQGGTHLAQRKNVLWRSWEVWT